MISYHPHNTTYRANNINVTRFCYQVVNSFFGFGNQAFVGLGGAAFVRSYSLSVRDATISRPTGFTYTVAGMGVTSSGTKGQNLILTKSGRTEWSYNKTDGMWTWITRTKEQKTRAPTYTPGTASKWDKKKQRRSVQVTGACMLSKHHADCNTKQSNLKPPSPFLNHHNNRHDRRAAHHGQLAAGHCRQDGRHQPRN